MLKNHLSKLFLLLALLFPIGIKPVSAQITPANDGTNTQVNTQGQQINISGGTQSQQNLYHSFQQFGLNQGQIANFLTNPNILNILGRVTGGEASFINGQIQVYGGNSNLYLMNPAGIIFGQNASLNVTGDFTATTANAIGIGNNWFNSLGNNNYNLLTGNPNSFAFLTQNPGAILNTGNLTTNHGSITLIGGIVVNTGTISTPNGNMTITATPGEKLVTISQEGNILSLQLPIDKTGLNSVTNTPLSLPQLLTGGNINNATGINVENGSLKLTSNNQSIPTNSGTSSIISSNINGKNLTISAQNLNLIESAFQIGENLTLLAEEKVKITDSVTSPLIAKAGGNLLIQGNKNIDIFALNHPNSGLFSGGDIIVRSTNSVGGDAHYWSGGNFRIEQLNGALGNLFSPYDPIIRSAGNVSFAGYTGTSLHILAGGSVNVSGSINITGTDINSISETVILSNGNTLIINGSTQPTLDIRAGTNAFGNVGTTGTFTPTLTTTGNGTNTNINIGSITNLGGVVFLTNQYVPNTLLTGGNITVGGINTATNNSSNGGAVTIDGRNNIVLTGGVNTQSTASGLAGNGGAIALIATGNISTQFILSWSYSTSANSSNGGAIALTSGGNISTATLDPSSPAD